MARPGTSSRALNNAAKHTPRGGHVVLEVERDGDEEVMRVRDDGAGIPCEMLETVFDLFVQSRSTIDRADGGLGVGLTLVKLLVEMHGGTVTAHSAGPGQGCEMVVRLPLCPGAIEAAPRHRSAAVMRLARGSRIAVVEDNADSREALCELLSLSGFDCHSAADGDAGLALVDRVRPQVAIVDLGLPGLDGFEMARRVRANPALKATCLVALTGYGQSLDRAKALHAGFDEHLVKPLDARVLMRLLALSEAGDESKTDGVASEAGAGARASVS